MASASEDADADTGAAAPPGDFGETLFQTAREVIETKCDEVFDAYCERVDEACRAAAKEGNMRAEMPPIVLAELEFTRTVFLEKLRDRYNKCGVHAQEDNRTRVYRGEDDDAVVFAFSWSCTNQSEGGRLQPLDPEGLALIKPARGEVPFYRGDEPNQTNNTYAVLGEPLKRFGQ